MQVDAGDHPSRKVHQRVREVAVVQVEVGSAKPGRGSQTETPVGPSVGHWGGELHT